MLSRPHPSRPLANARGDSRRRRYNPRSMLSREYLRENADAYRVALRNRGSKVDLDRVLDLDTERRRTITRAETLKNQRNVASQEIAALKKNKQDAAAQIEAMKRVGDEIKQLDERLAVIEEELRSLELGLPNVPHETVPVGADESANRVDRTWGEKPKFDFDPRPHWDIGEALGILDFDRAAKVSGARFALIFGAGARLNRALIDFFLDQNTDRGYKEVVPPFIVNADSLRGTGQLPKFEEDLFKLTDRDYYLIPTAEVPVTNIHRDEILDAATLPRRYTAYSPCFRSEAGSYGKDTRGLIRQHQFEKVEIVKIARPQDSYQILEALTGHAEKVLQRLELPYRVVALCAGELGFAAAKTYDLEVWLSGQQHYREISSCSNFEDFQARRMQARWRNPETGKPELVHTLNGSGVAVGRALIAVMENYQNADGSISVPAALH